MSSGGTINLTLNSILMLLEAIKELNIASQEKARMKASDGMMHNVDVMVKDENNKDIGFEKQKDGSYAVIADSAGLTPQQLKKQNEFVNKIRQRYAYNAVLNELKKKGYQLAEEGKAEKNTIKLVARRWVS
ncbi:MAG: DUF1257 domain-containing protein [Candidatus Omnitrophica bacterium]|nr:DUF1257 domain-containing protein [Candidatus Omnitrophota bacterium]